MKPSKYEEKAEFGGSGAGAFVPVTGTVRVDPDQSLGGPAVIAAGPAPAKKEDGAVADLGSAATELKSTLTGPISTVVAADLEGEIDLSTLDLDDPESRRVVRRKLKLFLMPYKFAVDEVLTKLRILQEEFRETGEYNPIEHVSGRLKEADSVIEKVQRRGTALTFEAMREEITDIAGVRVVCSFISDVYRVFELLTSHNDVRVHTVKDYIAKPKDNGYRSLHLILELPVFLSSGAVNTLVEVQIRTIAMDFWASLEHKIYYKYDKEVPDQLLAGLRDAADQAGQLDASMEWLHIKIRGEDRGTLIRRSSDALLAAEREIERRSREYSEISGRPDLAASPESPSGAQVQ